MEENQNGESRVEITNYDSAFAAFNNAANALSSGAKPIVKFIKGDWLVGQDDEELPPGTRLAADMMHAMWGSQRWKEGKPVERRMVQIASGLQPDVTWRGSCACRAPPTPSAATRGRCG
jgi:hypothetical protein